MCDPKRKDWSEKGFYGYACKECKVPDRAFIVFNEHVGKITKEEYKIFEELCKKYYPHLESKNMSLNRKSCKHWYEFLVKRK